MADKYVSVSALRELLGIPSDGQCTGCQFVTLHGCKDDSLHRACEAIDDAPEADVVEAVRCIDCVHLDNETGECRSPFGLERPNFNCYCSGGRRKPK